MKRTIIAIIIGFVLAVVISLFQFSDLMSVLAVLEVTLIENPTMQAAMLFEMTLRPYSLLIASLYIPPAALGVAGFLSGLISKSRKRMLSISVIILILLFLGYFLLYMASGELEFSALLSVLQTMYIDLGIAFFLLFIPGIIGATLTSED